MSRDFTSAARAAGEGHRYGPGHGKAAPSHLADMCGTAPNTRCTHEGRCMQTCVPGPRLSAACLMGSFTYPDLSYLTNNPEALC